MMHPGKWRDTCDPFALKYSAFRPTKILGYPHAGNDVFHAEGFFEGRAVRAYIKAARHAGAAIRNEAELLGRLEMDSIPRLIDAGFGDTPFSVTLELPGRRLSAIVGENADMASLGYMEAYGAALARIHAMQPQARPMADRKFFHAPPDALPEKLELAHMKAYFAEAPQPGDIVFCHGDFHYANLLWKDGCISGILDFELAGYSGRNRDIAWALILRPGQKFLKTEAERQLFLRGYGSCDVQAVRRWMARFYVYFLEFSAGDAEYCAFVRSWLRENCI